MNVAVFGTSGGVGRQVVDQAIAAGHEVRGLVRNVEKAPSVKNFEAIVGDISDRESVERVVAGTDAVIWAVGATRNSADQVELFESGARTLVAAMKQQGVSRLVALSGAGITIDGERKPLRGRAMSAVVKVLVRHVVESKRREYLVFRESGLDWTLVRPPRVVEGPQTGRYYVGDELRGSSVTQGDLAEFMISEAAESKHVRSAPFIGQST